MLVVAFCVLDKRYSGFDGHFLILLLSVSPLLLRGNQTIDYGWTRIDRSTKKLNKKTIIFWRLILFANWRPAREMGVCFNFDILGFFALWVESTVCCYSNKLCKRCDTVGKNRSDQKLGVANRKPLSVFGMCYSCFCLLLYYIFLTYLLLKKSVFLKNTFLDKQFLKFSVQDILIFCRSTSFFFVE